MTRSREFTMSLRQGWTKPDGSPGTEPVPGDLAIMCVATDPDVPVDAPPGWVAATARTFYKVIAAGEADPAFRAAVPVVWAVEGQIWSGIEPAWL